MKRLLVELTGEYIASVLRYGVIEVPDDFDIECDDLNIGLISDLLDKAVVPWRDGNGIEVDDVVGMVIHVDVGDVRETDHPAGKLFDEYELEQLLLNDRTVACNEQMDIVLDNPGHPSSKATEMKVAE